MTKKLFIAILLALCGCATAPKESACQKVERLKITEFDPDCYIEKTSEAQHEQELDNEVAYSRAARERQQKEFEAKVITEQNQARYLQNFINKSNADAQN